MQPILKVFFIQKVFCKHVGILDWDVSVAKGLILFFSPKTHFQLDINVWVKRFWVYYLFCCVPLPFYATSTWVIIKLVNFQNISCVVMMHWCFLIKLSSNVIVTSTLRADPSFWIAVCLFTGPSFTGFSFYIIQVSQM